MAKLGITTGTVPNDGTGDSLLDGAIKINSNFNEIYNYFGDGTNLNFTNSDVWNRTGSGINTLSNVGIGTTNPRFSLEIGSVGASGTSLWVNGDARVTGIFTVGSSSITLDGSNNVINVGTGVTIYGNTGIVSATDFYADGLRVGVITASTIVYQGGTLYNAWQETSAGIHTLSNVGIGTTNATDVLTVKGSTSLESLSATSAIFTSKVGSTGSYFYEGLDPSLIGSTGGSINGSSFGYATGGFFRYTSTSTDNVLKSYYKPTGQETVTLDIDGDLTLRTLNGNAKFIVSGDGDVLIGNNLNVSGVVTASSFVGDGSGLTNIPGGFLKNIVEDTSPQLGGYLDLNGKNIAGIGSISLTGDINSIYGFKSGNNNTRTSNAYYARWGPGRTEQFRMRVFDNVSGSTPGIEFAISYTDTEINVRQYSGTFVDGFPSVISNQLTLLDTSGNTIVNNNLGIGSASPQYKLDVGGDINFTGTLYQNGSVFSGGGGSSGVGVEDDGSSVGTATTINFGTGLSVSTVSAGIVTVTAIPTNNFYDGGVVTGNIVLTTVNKNQLVPVSTGSSISITLPAGSGLSPGDGFTIVDVGSSETSSGNAATFNITVTPNAADRIMGGTGPLIIDENGASVKLVWMGSTYDWRIV